MDPTEYAKQMRRHRYAIMSIAVALIVAALIIVFKCQILGYFGLPGCCCQGAHVAASSWPNVSASTVPVSGVTMVSRGGAPTGEIPFAPYRHGNAPVTSGSATAAAASPSLTFASSASALDMDVVQSVDITGELGDGGDEYVNIGPPITGIEPPDDCDGICWIIGKHHHGHKSPPCVTDCGTVTSPPVSAVPLPATWIMMLTGFFLMGTALRARRVTV